MQMQLFIFAGPKFQNRVFLGELKHSQQNPSEFLSSLFLAHVPGGTLQSVGQPGEHSGGPRCRRSAGEELLDLQRSGRQDAVPAEMAGHRRQRSPRDQELRKPLANPHWVQQGFSS